MLYNKRCESSSLYSHYYFESLRKNGLTLPKLYNLLLLSAKLVLADRVLNKKQNFLASAGNALAKFSQSIADAEWNIFMRAMRAFVEKYGQASFSFNYRTRADVGVAHADSFLRLYNGDLLFFENNQAKFMGLQNAMVSFELPKGGDFIRAFGATKECFQNERRALEESRPALLQQCEAVRSQIHEERQNMQAAFAAADGENSGLGQRICQLREQDQHMLEHAKGSRTPTKCSRLRMVFRKLGESNNHGNARRERAKERAQHPVAVVVCGHGFSRARSRRIAGAAGK
ncbi:hypothetical protein ERJ75_001061100 [Trypanosoma vivax]|nr:hypothetical protein ERJ75_001061100 [Trypanosoma vivax]